MRSAALVALALLVLAPQPAAGDSPTDYLGPRELAVGEASRADARGATATTLNPAGLALTRELAFDGTYGYTGGGDNGVHAASVSGCDSTTPISGCLHYRYYLEPGDGTRFRVHEVGSTAARAFGQSAAAGITVKYFDTAGPGDDDSGFAVDAGLIVRLADSLRIGAVGHNLVNGGAFQYPRAIGAGITARLLPALSLHADGMWQIEREEDSEGSTGRYGGGAEYFVPAADQQTGYPLRIGMVHDVAAAVDATYVTGGLGIINSSVALDVGARKQLEGDEITVLVSLRVFGPQVAAGSNPSP
ncbi:MAG TPA: hypothetical protein VNM90_29860 [Haliangium sp.]|nr:hypothetical protein [Haliangium sp.]